MNKTVITFIIVFALCVAEVITASVANYYHKQSELFERDLYLYKEQIDTQRLLCNETIEAINKSREKAELIDNAKKAVIKDNRDWANSCVPDGVGELCKRMCADASISDSRLHTDSL